jgi:hypothetical protein
VTAPSKISAIDAGSRVRPATENFGPRRTEGIAESYRNNRKLGSGRRDQFRCSSIAASMVADLDQVRRWMI